MALNFDHTAQDTAAAADFNRIEQYTAELVAILGEYGTDVTAMQPYFVQSGTHSAWNRFAYPTPQEIDRIHTNIKTIYAAFCTLPEFRTLAAQHREDGTRTLNFEGLNNIEWDLQLILSSLEAMISAMGMRQAATLYMQAGGMFNAG